MNCPNCGAPEIIQVRECKNCSAVYTASQLLEYRQLEYLLNETAAWGLSPEQRKPYLEKFNTLQACLVQNLPPQTLSSPVAAAPVQEPVVPEQIASREPDSPKQPLSREPTTEGIRIPKVVDQPMDERLTPKKALKPPPEGVSFDQWLLSERNIKFALYSGGMLLIVAGLIFVGVNWGRLPGVVKLLITLLITGVMYLGGYLLFKRPQLRIGGVALLGIASGFVPLNFIVLQIYIFKSQGVDANVTWLAGSLIALTLYLLTVLWTRTHLFSYLSLAATVSAATAMLFLTHGVSGTFLLVYSLIALLFELAAYASQSTRMADVARTPLLVVSQIATPGLFLIGMGLWVLSFICDDCGYGSPWLSLTAMLINIIFYLGTDLGFHKIIARWAAALALGIVFLIFLVQQHITAGAIVLALTFLALIYFLIEYHLYGRAQVLKFSNIIRLPWISLAQLLVPCLILFGSLIWAIEHDCGELCIAGSPWVVLASLLVVDIFYLVIDLILHWGYARWLAAFTFGLVYIFTLIQIGFHPASVILFLSILASGYLFIEYRLKWARKPEKIGLFHLPLTILAHLAMPFLFITASLLWMGIPYCQTCAKLIPGIYLAAMLACVLFYSATARIFHSLLARWAAVLCSIPFFIFLVIELGVSKTSSGMLLMMLALAYLLVGFFFQSRTHQARNGLPLYLACYFTALLVTFQALDAYRLDPLILAKALLGDVVLLVVSGAIHRQNHWIYGAAWLFIAPVYLFAAHFLQSDVQIGLAFGVLLFIYALVGYWIGQHALNRAWPLLTGGVILSFLVLFMVWTSPIVFSLSVGAIMILYLVFAIWLGWPWLTLATLGLSNLLVVAVLRIIFVASDSPWQFSLTTTGAGVGALFLLINAFLKSKGLNRWRWPFLLVAALDLISSYISALNYGGVVPIVLSIINAGIVFWLIWYEQENLARVRGLSQFFSYLGTLLIFIGFFVLLFTSLGKEFILFLPYYTVMFCGLLVFISLFMRDGLLAFLYGRPLRWSGLVVLFFSLIYSSLLTESAKNFGFLPEEGDHLLAISLNTVAIIHVIGGVILSLDAGVHRNYFEGYFGRMTFVIAIWTALLYFQINEWQAYVFPLVSALLTIGWSERRQGRRITSVWITRLSLLVLMGTAFIQSLDRSIYAALLLVESVASFGWGLHARSRGYIQLSAIALVVNAVVQIGPAVIELPRWVQIGAIGAILLGTGLIALFRREQIITARKNLTDEWSRWQL